MKGEFYFSCDKVYYDDLEELRKRQCKNDELRLCELSFIAADAARLSRTLLEVGLSPYEILAAIGSIDCIDEAPRTDALGKSLNYIDALSSLCRAADKAILSQLYVQRCKEQGVTVSSRDFFGDGEPEQTFTYVKIRFPTRRLTFSPRIFPTREFSTHPLTKFALWASEVIADSEVHFVSEVSPDGEVMGKLNFT